MTARRVLIAALLLLVTLPSAAQARGKPWRVNHWGWPSHARPFAVPALPAGDFPGIDVLDPATDTLYVTNADAGTLSVLDVSRCNARVRTNCHGGPAVPTGALPLGLALDSRRGTLYVANLESGTVSVIDATTCNARIATRCAPRATVPLGANPIGLAVDESTGTVYAGLDDQPGLALIDTRTCNRAVLTGCGGPIAHAAAGPGAAFPSFDPSTHTLYAPYQGATAVIDPRVCSAARTTGCAHPAATISAAATPFYATVAASTHTLYLADIDAGTVFVFDAATCNARVVSGCAAPRGSFRAGPEPSFSALIADGATLYVGLNVNEFSVVDTRRCRAQDTSGCQQHWPTLQTGDRPQWSVLDPDTATLFVVDGYDDEVIALDTTFCNALRTSGCRDEVPALYTGEDEFVVVDNAKHTVYATQGILHQLWMVDSRTCDARHPQGCTPVTASVPGISGPRGLVLDSSTQTLYATNVDDHTVVLIDPARCNVDHPGGCAPIGPPIPVGAGAVKAVVNERTHMLYVNNVDDSTITAIDATHCRVGDLASCAAPTRTGPVTQFPWAITVDETTNTVYVSGVGDEGMGDKVDVIDGANCCAVKAQVTVGHAHFDLAADPLTRTLYVPNTEFEAPGTMSIVDIRHCHARDVSGCGQTPPLAITGSQPGAVEVDPLTHDVYTADTGNGTVSIFDGSACNAQRTSGCARPRRQVPVGFWPNNLVLDPLSRTLFTIAGWDQGLSLIDVR